MKFLLSLVLLAMLIQASISKGSPYIGMETRDIKSLSQKQIADYLDGKGMGFSMVAELNSYPGARHVLDMAEQLQLSEKQIKKTNVIFQLMKIEAKKYGAALIEKEREIEYLFATKKIDAKKLNELTNGSAKIKAQIRLAHLNAHMSQQKILTEEQINKYDELRGYTVSQSQEHKHHH